jgi:hypothetical protein
VLARVEHRTGEHGGPDLVQRVLERGNHAKVAAAAAQRPKQVRVLVGAGPQESAVCRDDIRRDEVVGSQPARRTSQPIPPPRVKPAIPVVDTSPPVTASPKASVSWSRSCHRLPA